MANVVPGVTIEIDDTRATTPGVAAVKVLAVGIKTPAGSLAVDTPTKVFSDSEGESLAGKGSQLEQMVRYFRAQGPRVSLTIVAMDAPAGAAATGTLTFGGAATTAQSLILQVEDRTVTVPVPIGSDGTAVAAAAVAELADPSFDILHVTAANVLAVLTFTARSLGEHGNEISFRVQTLPPGVTATPAAMSGGTGAPDVASALATLGSERFNYIVAPDTNATNLTAIETFLDDRFTGTKALDGHAIVGKRDSVSNLATLGLGEDTAQITIFGDPNVPTNPWAQAAVIAAARANLENPKLSIRHINLTPIVAPDSTLFLDPDDRNTLLVAGISVYHFPTGTPRVDRFVTLYKTNSDGNASTAFFDAETKLTISEYRQFRILITGPEIGKTLVEDVAATNIGVDTLPRVIDVEGIRSLYINQYNNVFGGLAWTSNNDEFAESLVVALTAPDTVTIQEFPTINGILYQVPGTISFSLRGS